MRQQEPATDAAGAPVASLPVTLTITGVDPQQLTATTDPTSQALFTYTGTRGGGTDNLQAQATLSGMPTTSNVATVPWSGPINQAPVVNAGLPVTVTFPNTAVLSGSATDDGLPRPSTLTYTWSMLSGPGTVTFGAQNALTGKSVRSPATLALSRLIHLHEKYGLT